MIFLHRMAILFIVDISTKRGNNDKILPCLELLVILIDTWYDNKVLITNISNEYETTQSHPI